MAAPKNPASKEEAVALMKGPLGPAVRKVAVDYVAPFLWSVPAKDGGIDARNGSAFFINGDRGVFLVTAHHVLKEFVAAREDFGRAVACQVCNVPFHPEDRLIDSDEKLDIATFRVSEREFRRTGKMLMSFQHMIPEVGKGVFFAGFPGRERRRLEARTIES